MRKEQVAEVKKSVDEITGTVYTKTFSNKSETLHIRIGTYVDSQRESSKEWIEEKLQERKAIIEKLAAIFPQYEIRENNKRYQGFINDICITVR